MAHMTEPASAQQTHCVLEHRLFAFFDTPFFRRSDMDTTAVMVVRLGEREASMPLDSIRREFGIAEDTPDGRMLAMINEALDFVPVLRIGDLLPSEILTGSASWEPGPDYRRLALTRLQVQLVAWLHGENGAETTLWDPAALAGADEDPVLRQQIQDAFQRAATALDLPSKEAVIAQMEDLAYELSFIEASRERLLDRVRRLARRLEQWARSFRGDSEQRTTLDRLRHLSGEALRQINHRFEQQDAQTGEILSALRHLDSHRTFIRSNRDWLHRCDLAWAPLLDEWDQAGDVRTEAHRALLARTYQFLAPRFMPVTEWLKPRKPGRKDAPGPRMDW